MPMKLGLTLVLLIGCGVCLSPGHAQPGRKTQQKPDAPDTKTDTTTDKRTGTTQTTPVSTTGKNAAAKTAAKRAKGITPSREAAARTFAKLHHPELGELLESLKKSQRPAYNKAIIELFTTSERLERLREKSPARYELALETWKLDSRIRLLTAYLMSSSTDELEAQLHDLLMKRIDLKVKSLEDERQRALDRAKKVTVMIENIEKDRDAVAKRDLMRIKRELGLQSPKQPRKKTRTGNPKTSETKTKTGT